MAVDYNFLACTEIFEIAYRDRHRGLAGMPGLRIYLVEGARAADEHIPAVEPETVVCKAHGKTLSYPQGFEYHRFGIR